MNLGRAVLLAARFINFRFVGSNNLSVINLIAKGMGQEKSEEQCSIELKKALESNEMALAKINILALTCVQHWGPTRCTLSASAFVC